MLFWKTYFKKIGLSKIMCDYKIPIVPNLSFEKTDEGHYFFKINEGNLKSKETGNVCEIFNIEIDIYDKINVKFEIDDFNYMLFFMEEVPSDEEGKRTFVYPNTIKYFDIKCNLEEYGVTLLNFYSNWETNEFKNGISTNMIFGECTESIFLKNNTKINNDERVNVWNILECSNVSQTRFVEFDSEKLNGLFLKSKNTLDYYHEYETSEDLEKRITFQEKQKDSFNQLLDNDAFLYHEMVYSETDGEVIKNIDKLLMFYDSNIVPSRFLILESVDNDKLEIRIKSKNSFKLKGSSIFKVWPNNLFDFINSSYDSYLAVKNSEIDIDLLLHYYAWIKNEQYIEVKLMLCSAFFEVLKNNKLNPSKNEGKFYGKLIQRFSFLKLDSYKILKFSQEDVVNCINKLEKKYSNEEYSNKNVQKIFKRYKNELLFIFIKKYRNKIIHSGKFELTNNDIEGMINELIEIFKKSYKNEEQIELVEKIGEDIKNALKNTGSLFDIYNQSRFFERIVEIILLKIFNTDCTLSFNHDLDNLSPELEDFNSKKYIDKFIKK